DIVPLEEQAIRGLLAEHGFTGSIEVTEKAAALLEAFDWPGNVRELRAVAERAAIHSGMDQSRVLIRAVHLPERVRDFDPSMATDPRLTRSLVESVMDEVGGNQSEAARRLGVHRNTIARYLRTG
ncbi:MAG: helix-turn-helix domain-containing protein, partial [Gemmatimonadota bacterium]